MIITPIHTDVVRANSTTLTDFLDRHVSDMPENSILAITSKIVSLCEGRVQKKSGVSKEALAEQEAEWYLPAHENSYGFTLAIKHSMLIPSSGIDESNADGVYVLWPEDPQKSANEARAYLAKRFLRKHIGVIVTDSRATPLRWGTTGAALSHSGFAALNDYIGKPDIFGRNLTVTKANVKDALATAAVAVMGEGAEQNPLALIMDVPFVTFQSQDPTQEELEGLNISIDDDVYASILKRAPWKKGGTHR
jgi:dihydrofolate synthase / folylpolyglutamate synthase